jgi:hypothetical protein
MGNLTDTLGSPWPPLASPPWSGDSLQSKHAANREVAADLQASPTVRRTMFKNNITNL